MINSMIQALKNLFSKPATHAYPQSPLPLPDQYRGLIEFDENHCIYCDKCEKVCPPRAIVFSQHEDGSKTYNYNPWLCIYCGECVRACPKPGEALWQSESKPLVALKEKNVNSEWFAWQKHAAKSRVEYKELQRLKKER